VQSYTPFDPVSKRTEATASTPDGSRFRISKGAPQVIAELCVADPAFPTAAMQTDQFDELGYRSLAVARDGPNGRWHLLGVIPLADPAREDSAATITAARQLGVQVKMITGDQIAIGAQIAREVGLGAHILPAEALQTSASTIDDQVAELVEAADGFAQVFPEHKYRIVQLLQQRGHIVGMASYATYRITETIRILLLISLAIVAFDFFPVTAIMIVLLAVLNNGAILSIAYYHVHGSARPAVRDRRTVLTLATVLGAAGVTASFLLFALTDQVFGLDHDLIRTLIYLKLSVAGHLTIFITHTHWPFWSRPAPSRLPFAAVLGTQLLATVIAATGLFMTPLGWGRAALVWAYALAWFLVNDRIKLATYAVLDRRARHSGVAAAGTTLPAQWAASREPRSSQVGPVVSSWASRDTTTATS